MPAKKGLVHFSNEYGEEYDPSTRCASIDAISKKLNALQNPFRPDLPEGVTDPINKVQIIHLIELEKVSGVVISVAIFEHIL
jgi:hypothetical protein